MTPEIIAQMPLKSFLSVIPGEAIEQMIVELNALCQLWVERLAYYCMNKYQHENEEELWARFMRQKQIISQIR